jgi:hypothetical protein
MNWGCARPGCNWRGPEEQLKKVTHRSGFTSRVCPDCRQEDVFPVRVCTLCKGDNLSDFEGYCEECEECEYA